VHSEADRREDGQGVSAAVKPRRQHYSPSGCSALAASADSERLRASALISGSPALCDCHARCSRLLVAGSAAATASTAAASLTGPS
jgi:hypothetical protein